MYAPALSMYSPVLLYLRYCIFCVHGIYISQPSVLVPHYERKYTLFRILYNESFVSGCLPFGAVSKGGAICIVFKDWFIMPIMYSVRTLDGIHRRTAIEAITYKNKSSLNSKHG